jgi:hypothetical protein
LISGLTSLLFEILKLSVFISTFSGAAFFETVFKFFLILVAVTFVALVFLTGIFFLTTLALGGVGFLATFGLVFFFYFFFRSFFKYFS